MSSFYYSALKSITLMCDTVWSELSFQVYGYPRKYPDEKQWQQLKKLNTFMNAVLFIVRVVLGFKHMYQ